MDDLRYQVDLLKAMNKKLIDENKELNILSDSSSSALALYNYDSNRISTYGDWDSYFQVKILTYSDLSLLSDYFDEENSQLLMNTIYADKRGVEKASAEVCMRDGVKHLECIVTIIYDGMHRPKYKTIRFRDVTKLSLNNEMLRDMAYNDNLTGLYNRNYFVTLLDDFLKKAPEENREVAVLFIDIDDFRKINDSMGITAGDELVQMVGERFKVFSSSKVLVSHFNSDIFCIAIYDPVGADSVENVYDKIHELMEKPYDITSGQSVSITVSVGVAVYPEASQKPLELINCAEIVMFKSKSSGKNTIQYFDAPIIHEFLRSIQIENKLKKAILSESFEMYFQPQYDIKSSKMRGMEALIRWRDDDGKMIPPSDFIPIAEKNGTIVQIGSFVIENSIKHFSEWIDKFGIDSVLSLNISAIQYKQDGFIDEILKTIEKYHVSSKQIELEITESVLINDYKEITDKLTVLRDYGIKISLDDFGTGYSSLSYLKNLPLDTLKIDKSFIDTVTTDYNSKVIIETIIYMAGKLGLDTIAEGVESKEQFEYLCNAGCCDIQGYYLGRPMSADKMTELLDMIKQKEDIISDDKSV